MMAEAINNHNKQFVAYSSDKNTTTPVGLQICRRPDRGGCAGRKTTTLSNHYPIQIDFGRKFYQYAVEVECVFAKAGGATGVYSVNRDLRQYVKYLNV